MNVYDAREVLERNASGEHLNVALYQDIDEGDAWYLQLGQDDWRLSTGDDREVLGLASVAGGLGYVVTLTYAPAMRREALG